MMVSVTNPTAGGGLKKYSKIVIFKDFLLYFVLQLHQRYPSWELAKIGTLAKQMWN